MYSTLVMPHAPHRINKGTDARRRARIAAAKAPAVRKIEDKRRKPAKHRKPFREDA